MHVSSLLKLKAAPCRKSNFCLLRHISYRHALNINDHNSYFDSLALASRILIEDLSSNS